MALVGVAAVLMAVVVIAYDRVGSPMSESLGKEIPSADSLMDVCGHTPAGSTIIDYHAFRLSFNPGLHIPNWVSWELTAEETCGKLPRGRFRRDPGVEGCADTEDYTGSGYDRGHMAPAADMKWSREAMEECFYMTNICPQARVLNGGPWKKLEEKCRLWAQADSAIIIVCGPVLPPSPLEYIGRNEVAVPQAYFKVVCAPYANPPRAIGFLMPNAKVAGGLQATAVSVDSVESLTGYDFFAALPDSIENQIEQECRFHFWSTIRPQ